MHAPVQLMQDPKHSDHYHISVSSHACFIRVCFWPDLYVGSMSDSPSAPAVGSECTGDAEASIIVAAARILEWSRRGRDEARRRCSSHGPSPPVTGYPAPNWQLSLPSFSLCRHHCCKYFLSKSLSGPDIWCRSHRVVNGF